MLGFLCGVLVGVMASIVALGIWLKISDDALQK